MSKVIGNDSQSSASNQAVAYLGTARYLSRAGVCE